MPQVSFTFEPDNPFLLDAQLTKEFRFAADGSLSVSSTVPRWRDGRGAPFAGEGGGGGGSGGGGGGGAGAGAGGEGTGTGTADTASQEQRTRRTRSFFQWFTTSEHLGAAQHDPIADFIRDDLWAGMTRCACVCVCMCARVCLRDGRTFLAA